jgi:hypothetical protein
MKIISKFILFTVVLCLMTNIVFSLQTENSNSNANTIKTANSNSNTNAIKTNEGIFESMAKYRLKNKSKAKTNKTSLKSNSENKNRFKQAQPKVNIASGNNNKPKGYFRGPIEYGPNKVTSSNSSQVGNTGTVIYNNTKPGSSATTIMANGNKMFEGWVQFYLYNTADKDDLAIGAINERYYKNFAFNAQARRIQNIDLTTMEGNAPKYVPTLYDFWLTVFEGSMNFSAERDVI